MICLFHPSKVATGFCSACGCGLCIDCFSSAHRFDKKPLCITCYQEYLMDKLKNIKKNRTHSIISVLLLGLPGALFVLLTPSDTPERRMRYKITTRESENETRTYVEEDTDWTAKIVAGIIVTVVAAAGFFIYHLVKLFIYPFQISKIQHELEEINKPKIVNKTQDNTNREKENEDTCNKKKKALSTEMFPVDTNLENSQIQELSNEISKLRTEISNLNKLILTESSILSSCNPHIQSKKYGEYVKFTSQNYIAIKRK